MKIYNLFFCWFCIQALKHFQTVQRLRDSLGQGFRLELCTVAERKGWSHRALGGTTLPHVTAKLRQWPHLLIWKQRFLRSSFRMGIYKFVPSFLRENLRSEKTEMQLLNKHCKPCLSANWKPIPHQYTLLFQRTRLRHRRMCQLRMKTALVASSPLTDYKPSLPADRKARVLLSGLARLAQTDLDWRGVSGRSPPRAIHYFNKLGQGLKHNCLILSYSSLKESRQHL